MKPIPYNPKDVWRIELKNIETGEVYEGEYVDMRLRMDTIPRDKFAYNCRHGDDMNWVDPITIEKRHIVVNFADVFITDKEIVFPKEKEFINVAFDD